MLSPHLAYLQRILVDAAIGRRRFIVVCFPPRHGKTEFASRYFPAWFLGNFPDKRVLLASYEADFAAQHGAFVRDVLHEHGREVFGIELRRDSKARGRWNVARHSGGMQAVGVGGAIMGKGADLLIIDDPIKSWQEALSDAHRDAVWDTYTAARTRLEPGGSALVIMQRWHEDDLAGRLLQQAGRNGADPWEIVLFPALARENDPLGRAPGEALWPERYSVSDLQQIRASIGEFRFEAQYQQNPLPQGGGLFKREWFRYFKIGSLGDVPVYIIPGREGVPASQTVVFCTVDLAASMRESADYFVCATWAQTRHGDLLLLDVVRRRVEGPDQLALVSSIRERWGASLVCIERAGYQLAFVQQAQRAGLPVRELVPHGDKFGRALSIAARYESGRVFHLEAAPWLYEYESELLAFGPGCAHDDQVDCAAYAALQIAPGLTWAKARTVR
jgi:predicted phage terminase large subunit-like protein